MKYYLYILYSEKYKKHYIGISDNPDRRLAEHNQGIVRSTKAFIPYGLVYLEEFPEKKSARIRELFLKRTAKERERLYRQIHGAIV